MSKKLYLFDFDGTISNKDSLFDFLIKTVGLRRFIIKVIINFPIMVYLAIIKNDKSYAKEKLLSVFLKGKSKTEVENLGNIYANNHIDKIIRPKAFNYLKQINRDKSSIYIVSASLDVWLKTFAEKMGVKLISTKLKYRDSICTGTFYGKNCKGIEKVNRIKEIIDLKEYSEIISFGDSNGDKEMFKISTQVNYKPFR